jgi:hypothetical protein
VALGARWKRAKGECPDWVIAKQPLKGTRILKKSKIFSEPCHNQREGGHVRSGWLLGRDVTVPSRPVKASLLSHTAKAPTWPRPGSRATGRLPFFRTLDRDRQLTQARADANDRADYIGVVESHPGLHATVITNRRLKDTGVSCLADPASRITGLAATLALVIASTMPSISFTAYLGWSGGAVFPPRCS